MLWVLATINVALMTVAAMAAKFDVPTVEIPGASFVMGAREPSLT